MKVMNLFDALGPQVVQLRGPANEVLWEGTPVDGALTNIPVTGLVCTLTLPDGTPLYDFRSIFVCEGGTFTFRPDFTII